MKVFKYKNISKYKMSPNDRNYYPDKESYLKFAFTVFQSTQDPRLKLETKRRKLYWERVRETSHKTLDCDEYDLLYSYNRELEELWYEAYRRQRQIPNDEKDKIKCSEDYEYLKDILTNLTHHIRNL
jgi:hypothetical protein